MNRLMAATIAAAISTFAVGAHSEPLDNTDHVRIQTGLLKVTEPGDPADDEIITLNGVKLNLSESVKGNPNTTLSYHYSTPDADYVLLALSQNAEACPIQYSWMKLSRNSYGYSPVFGTCSDQASVKVSGSKLVVQMSGYVAPSLANMGDVSKAQLRAARKLHTYIFDTSTGQVTENGKPIKG
jgi:hypothetical protein